MSLDEVLNRLAERTSDNTRQLRKQVQQRRNGMEDLYGTVFSADGDDQNPATFYISLSPDLVYLERFAFKFVIKPFATTVKGGTSSAVVYVDNTELLVNNNTVTGDPHNHIIAPNPHTHATQPHTHNMVSGKSFIDTTSDYWRVYIDGVNITPYLIEQHGGQWIHGEGIFPNGDLVSQGGFYDILDVASMMIADNKESQAQQILEPRFKRVQIYSDAPFSVDAYLYLKYSAVNR